MKILRPMSPFRRRMLEAMQLRPYSPHTSAGSLRSVAQCATHFPPSPDRLGAAHLRTSQLPLLQPQVSKRVVLQTGCA